MAYCKKGVPFRQVWLRDVTVSRTNQSILDQNTRGICQGLTFKWLIELSGGNAAETWLPSSRSGLRRLSVEGQRKIEHAVDL